MNRGIRHSPWSISEQTGYITPDDGLFVINHLGQPEHRTGLWRLDIGGLVEKPLSLDINELSRLAAIEVTAFLKCAGSPFAPNDPTPDRVGNVTWSGVALATLLAEARPHPKARFVVTSGADEGEFEGIRCNAYVKDLPLELLTARNALLALKMNGRDLTAARGGPVRLVVPGFYGTNAVKWVRSIELAEARAEGPFTTIWYNDEIVDPAGIANRVPVWAVAAESAIAFPRASAVVAAGCPVAVAGWAWGDIEIAGVDVALDETDAWMPTRTLPRADHGWQAFSTILPALPPGRHVIRSRARDGLGRLQPFSGARNASVPITFTVGR
jgi:sulfane dehydrogenase subunit SoxC